jgi:hypothetical protein
MALTAPAITQQGGLEEVIVTAQRRQARDFDASAPAVGLRRVADYAVQTVTVAGDTRDPDKRHGEIFAMIRGAIDLAAKRGNIELATGEIIVEPLTAANYTGLTLKSDGRPDSEKTSFLVKARLAADMTPRPRSTASPPSSRTFRRWAAPK